MIADCHFRHFMKRKWIYSNLFVSFAVLLHDHDNTASTHPIPIRGVMLFTRPLQKIIIEPAYYVDRCPAPLLSPRPCDFPAFNQGNDDRG